MTEWEHKERNWQALQKQDDASGQSIETADFIPPDGHRDGYYERNSKWLKFTDWLDMQCKGGWEIFKISRTFGDPSKTTWCVFRRKI